MEFWCGEFDAGIKKKKKNLTVQNYLDFIESHKQSDLSVALLNKIISIHGFKMLNKVKKESRFNIEVLINAVQSIELMDLTRSTLKDDNVSSCGFISPKETIKDLISLKWMECSITSFKTLNSENYSLFSLQNENTTALKSKPGKKKRPKMCRLTDGMEPACSSIFDDRCGAEGKSSDCAAADHLSLSSLMVITEPIL